MSKRILLLAMVAHMGMVPHIHAQGLSAEQKAQIKKWGAVVGGAAVIIGGLIYAYKRPVKDRAAELQNQIDVLTLQSHGLKKDLLNELQKQSKNTPLDQQLPVVIELVQADLEFCDACTKGFSLPYGEKTRILKVLKDRFEEELPKFNVDQEVLAN